MTVPAMAAQDLVRSDGLVALDRLGAALNLSPRQLGQAAGLSPDTMAKPKRIASSASQAKLRDFAEIIGRVAPWAGSVPQAFAWYRAQPIPSFGDQTAEELVRDGRASAVKAYLSRIAVGGYA